MLMADMYQTVATLKAGASNRGESFICMKGSLVQGCCFHFDKNQLAQGCMPLIEA